MTYLQLSCSPSAPATARLTRSATLVPRPAPAGFTLVELLVVILIIAILASMVLFAMVGVTESAKVDRTRSQIARINELLLQKWEEYQTRRVPMSRTHWNAMHGPAAATLPLRSMATYRLNALRELMRMEMPDRISDVTEYASSQPAYLKDPVTGKANYPSLWRAYLRKATNTTWTPENESSECLYLILSQIQDGDFNALEFFNENEIGDTDGDAMPEILDAWGTPIRWLRWTPGFVSPLQPAIMADGSKTVISSDSLDLRMAGLFSNVTRPGQDLFDTAQMQTGTWEIRPLVISAGPDKSFDIAFSYDEQKGGASFTWSAVSNNPYDTNAMIIGSVADTNGDGIDNSIDNIHNQLIETR